MNDTARSAANKATAKRKKPAVYGRLRVLIDPKTGAEVRAIGLEHATDLNQLRERNFRNGDVVRVTVEKGSDPWLNRTTHVLGRIVSENVPGFSHLNAHQCLKRLQAESGVHCEPIQIVEPSGETAVVNIPISLSFAETDGAEYRSFAQGICRYLCDRYWHDMTPDEVENMVEIQSKLENL